MAAKRIVVSFAMTAAMQNSSAQCTLLHFVHNAVNTLLNTNYCNQQTVAFTFCSQRSDTRFLTLTIAINKPLPDSLRKDGVTRALFSWDFSCTCNVWVPVLAVMKKNMRNKNLSPAVQCTPLNWPGYELALSRRRRYLDLPLDNWQDNWTARYQPRRFFCP